MLEEEGAAACRSISCCWLLLLLLAAEGAGAAGAGAAAPPQQGAHMCARRACHFGGGSLHLHRPRLRLRSAAPLWFPSSGPLPGGGSMCICFPPFPPFPSSAQDRRCFLYGDENDEMVTVAALPICTYVSTGTQNTRAHTASFACGRESECAPHARLLSILALLEAPVVIVLQQRLCTVHVWMGAVLLAPSALRAPLGGCPELAPPFFGPIHCLHPSVHGLLALCIYE